MSIYTNKKTTIIINITKTKNNMKKLIITIAFAAISMMSFAQLTKIPVTKDSTIMMDKLYVGMLSGSEFSTDSLYASTFANIRFGVMGTYQPAKWIAVKAWAMYQGETQKAPWQMQQFWLKLTPNKKLSIEAGNMATLPTEQRPHPVSGDGQFETFSEAQIVGMALNAKIKYTFTSDIQAGAGIAVRKDKPEYSGMVNYKKVTLSAWYAEYNQKVGTALTLHFTRVYSTLVWKQDQIVSEILVIHLNKDKSISLYADTGYDLGKKDIVRGEWGLLKTFKSEYINGLYGLGYNHETNTVNGYLFLHL
ncbi:MAG: hypothetical protein WC606_05785 [Candidatus Absconditabacterales bacterium]|jgi:hypothetical protein